MRLSGLIVGIIAAIGFVVPVIWGPAQSSTTVLGLNCIGVATSPYYCQGGSHNSLRNNANAGYNNATVAGAVAPSDGEFACVGIGAALGLGVDSADDIACTTSYADWSIEFYDLKTKTGTKQTLPGATGVFFDGGDVQFDPINDLFLIDQPMCSDGGGSCVYAYTPQGQMVEVVAGLADFGHIALNPGTRTGFMLAGALGNELQSFSY